MKRIFSDHELPHCTKKSIFLAGPSIRNHMDRDWRHDALQYLEQSGFDGDVLIPIPEDVFYHRSALKREGYDNQITWEESARAMADIIVFWIPRDIESKVYGLTTNYELGRDIATGKVVYGHPVNADKVSYLDRQMADRKYKIHYDLDELLLDAVSYLHDYQRTGAEVQVPSNVWRMENFQRWLINLKLAGNHLHSARVRSVFPERPGPIFSFIMDVVVWIEGEQRYKANEFICARTDISTIIPYYLDEQGETFVLMVKEFRSPANNSFGYVFEFPGGSAKHDEQVTVLENALKELDEEAGLKISADRAEYISSRQLASTFSIHNSHSYRVLMTKQEYELMQKLSFEGHVFSDDSGGELTTPVLINKKNIFDYPIDYSNLGILLESKI